MRTPIITLFTIMIVSCATAMAAEVYVAPTGSDTNPGTKDKPFATLERAADTKMPSGQLYETQVSASYEPLVAKCDYSLWIPEDTPVVKSVFVINMRAAGKHLFYKDPEWRAMASRNEAAMLYCKFEAMGVHDNGYGLSMLTACDQFAAELKRPELRHAPFVLWGHSMGGRVTQDFVRFMPSRVLTFHIALRAFPSSEAFMKEEAEAMCVPGLYLMGEKDSRPKDIREHFDHARKEGSPRAWIWLSGQGHMPKGMDPKNDNIPPADWRAWAANDVVIPWTEAMIRLRLPKRSDLSDGPVKLRPIDITQGWLGDIRTGQVNPYSTFLGSKSEASWFPNERVAKAWAQFSFTGTDPSHDNAGEKTGDGVPSRTGGLESEWCRPTSIGVPRKLKSGQYTETTQEIMKGQSPASEEK